MARNEEKAQAMLNRWWNMKKDLNKGPAKERPKTHHRIMQLNNLNDCEKYRKAILKEVNKSVLIIQNAGLGEHKIRELNDEINKLLKEKSSYELRIKELGGPDYKVSVERMHDDEGDILPGSGDYFYFGAAKDLPGVRELFQKKKPEAPRRNMLEIYKGLDYEEYFGKRDNEDITLLEEEKAAEQRIKDQELEKWTEQNKGLIIERLKKTIYSKEEVLQLIDQLAEEDSDVEDNKLIAEDDEADQDAPQIPKKKWEEMTDEEKYVEKKKSELLASYLGVTNKNQHLQNKLIPTSQDNNSHEQIIEELIQMQKE